MGIISIIDTLVYGEENWMERAVKNRSQKTEHIIKKVGGIDLDDERLDRVLKEGEKWLD